MCKMNNTLDNGDNKTAIIAGASFGALVVFLVMLTVVGTTICIKKGMYFKFIAYYVQLQYYSVIDQWSF